MNKLILATGCDVNYVKKIDVFLNTIQENSNFDENYLVIYGNDNVTIPYDKIKVVNVNPNDIKSITKIKCLQHGEFLKSVELSNNLNDDDVILYTDGDIWLQRPLTDDELIKYRQLKDDDVFIGYNMHPNQKLDNEYNALFSTRYKSKIFNSDWSEIKCYNTGAIAMNKKTWIKLANQYCEWFSEVDKMFDHYAKQQWLISYIIGTQGYNIIEMGYDIHNHTHHGKVEGTVVDEYGVISYDNKIVLLKHKWNNVKEIENVKKKVMGYTQFNDDVFVVDCWPDNKDKENVLKKLLTSLKVYNCPIILCGHYPVSPEIQVMVDYYIYDSNNDILLEKDFEKYGINSDRWTDMGSYKITNKIDFHHDYAIWLTMKNAFNLVKQLGKQYIHFLEYDNLPDEIQYRQSFMEYVRNNDAVVYEYSEGSTRETNPYSSAFIFSIKTDVALKMISLINSKEEYFKGKPDRWQLEKQLYQSIKKVTNSVFVSKYIPNDNELNIFAVWNRNGILKNGARLQTYLGVDEAGQLFVHFISGFSEQAADKDYLIEINYGSYKKFHTIKKGEYKLERLGDYKQNEIVEVFYQGKEIFSQELKDEMNEFRRKNKLTRKNVNTNRKVNIHFVDGPFVEVIENGDYLYNVQFIDKKNGKLEFEFNLKSNHWVKSVKKYYIDWLIKIKGVDNDYYGEYNIDLTDKRVMICFESKSLGDNLAWMEYIEKFRTENKCKVICSSFQVDLFKDQYPEIEFVTPGSNVNNIYALYRLGLFYNDKREIDYTKHYNDPKKEPLMKVASDILGLTYEELKPKLPKLGKKKKKMVTIAIHSTSQCKYWNNPTGWQEVVDYLKANNYEVRLLSREEDGYMGNKHPKGITIQPKSTLKQLIKVLQESELFIGISSGLSWLAWASETPTVIISGFTDVDLEPLDGITRIINKEVCNSCWSNYEFNPGNWSWCPVHEKTERQFECSKTITGGEVIKKIEKLLSI